MLRRSGFLTRLTIGLVLAGVFITAWVNRQDIYDWARLISYDPPTEIAQLAKDSSMDNKGRKLFYVNHPDISTKEEFRKHCPQSEQTIVLGCYVKNKGIYIFNVTDSRLNGVKQVTAAHEMLHAAYDRLGKDEKKRVNSLVEQAYAGVANERVRSTIETYRQAGADTTNELHSILGTEVRQLPAELEEYYRQYFEDRLRVVAYAEAYESVFTQKQNEQEALLAKINSLKSELATEKEAIESQEASLNNQRNDLNQLANNGQVEAYNSRVANYNAQVSAFQRRVNSFNTKVEELNRLVEEYNDLGAEQTELYNAIDSRGVPQAE